MLFTASLLNGKAFDGPRSLHSDADDFRSRRKVISCRNSRGLLEYEAQDCTLCRRGCMHSGDAIDGPLDFSYRFRGGTGPPD
jgi:hypothetical protein